MGSKFSSVWHRSPYTTKLSVIDCHPRVFKIEASEWVIHAPWLEGHAMQVEATHKDPCDHLPVLEFDKEASLLQEVQEGIL